MKQLKKTLLTLVALFAMTTGAWAQTVVNIGTMCPPDETTMEYNGDTWQWVQCNPAITNGYVDVKIVNGALKNDNTTPTVTQLIHAFTICNLMIFGEQGKVSTVQLLNANGEKVKEVTVNKELKWDGNNISIAPADLLSGAMAENYIIRVNLSEYSLAMEKTKDKNEWTLAAMPAGNVELQVAYFPGMLTLPAKTAQGSIEVVGLGGETLPAGFDTDGTNYYVEPKTQFQVKAVPAEGYKVLAVALGSHAYDVDANGIATVTMPEGDTDETLTGIFTNQFELTFDDVNFKTNANITVKVGDADKTLDQDGKLSVKAGQTVTLTAKQGYKFRSVEAKKAAKAPTTAQFTVPNEWYGDNTKVTASDLPGFVALTDEEAANIVCPDPVGDVRVIHSVLDGGYIKIIAFSNGEKQGQQSFTLLHAHNDFYDNVNNLSVKYYYTTGK